MRSDLWGFRATWWEYRHRSKLAFRMVTPGVCVVGLFSLSQFFFKDANFCDCKNRSYRDHMKYDSQQITSLQSTGKQELQEWGVAELHIQLLPIGWINPTSFKFCQLNIGMLVIVHDVKFAILVQTIKGTGTLLAPNLKHLKYFYFPKNKVQSPCLGLLNMGLFLHVIWKTVSEKPRCSKQFTSNR